MSATGRSGRASRAAPRTATDRRAAPPKSDARPWPLALPPLHAAAAIALLVVTIAAVFLRTATLGGESLEGDEVFSWRVASRPPAAALEVVLRDIVHPPVYYVLLKLVVAVAGDGPTALRALSITSGTLLVVGTAYLGRRLYAAWTPAVTAAALVAASDLQIFNSQQTRSYALYALLTIAMLAALVRALDAPERLGRWAAYAAAAVAVVLTHYVGAFYVAATAPAVLLHPRRRAAAPRWVAASALAAVALLGWLAVVLPYYRARQGLGTNLEWMKVPAFSELLFLFATFGGVGTYRRAVALSLAVALVFVVLALLVAARRATPAQRATAWGVVLVGTVAALPPLALFGVAWLPGGPTVFGDRHTLPSQAPWALLLAAALLPLRQRGRPAVAVGAAALVALQLAPTLAAMRYPRRVPYAAIAELVRTRVPPGEPALTTDWYMVGAPVNYALRPRRDTVAQLGATNDRLPSAFWLAYRPDNRHQRERVATLERLGWTRREAHDYTTTPTAAWGTRVVRLAR